MPEVDINLVKRRLEDFRHKLLDTSLQNRLINFRPSTKGGKPLERVVVVHGESPDEILKILVGESKAMSFSGKPDPRPQRTGGGVLIEEPGEAELSYVQGSDEAGWNVDQTDLKLNTHETVTALAIKLTKIWRDSRTAIEEQGVNSLFLVLGFLEWYESESSQELRRAPLFLLPVQLDRTGTGAFRLRHDGEDVVGNLPIAAKLKSEFGIKLPEISEDANPSAYFSAVADAIKTQDRWAVDPAAVALGFFSYAKYLMYRDLDQSGWPEDRQPEVHPVLGALLESGFNEEEVGVSEDTFLDPLRPPQESCEVYDADSSQVLAILQANAGQSMIIEGPPGTGKSQTITNLIAEAIGGGKRVLFVAEKAAALDVVHRRLQEACLQDACLELHSNKANKRGFYVELKRTVEIAPPRSAQAARDLESLSEARGKLNEYDEEIHRIVEGRGVSPRYAMGRLIEMGPEHSTEGRHSFSEMAGWDQESFLDKLDLAGKLERHIAVMGQPADNPYFGCTLEHFLPSDKEDLARLLAIATEFTDQFHLSANTLAEALKVDLPVLPADVDRLRDWTLFIAGAPDVSGIPLNEIDWGGSESDLRDSLGLGLRYSLILTEIHGQVAGDALDKDLTDLVSLLRLDSLNDDERHDARPTLNAMDAATVAAFALRDAANKLASELIMPSPNIPTEVNSIVAIARRISSAPNIQGMASSDPTWVESADKIDAALQAVRIVQDARSRFGTILFEQAWATDVRFDLDTLEREGHSPFRLLKGAFRSAMSRTDPLFRQPTKDPAIRIAALKGVVAAADATKELGGFHGRCSTLFGEAWKGASSDLQLLPEAASWLIEAHRAVASGRIPLSALEYMERKGGGAEVKSLGEETRQLLERATTALDKFGRDLNRAGFECANESIYIFLTQLLRHNLTGLKNVILGAESKGFSRCLQLLELIQEAQRLRNLIRADVKAARAFGPIWSAEQTNWESASTILDWSLELFRSIGTGELPAGLMTFFVEGCPRSGLDEAVRRAQENRLKAQEAVRAVLDHVRLSGDPKSFVETPIATQRELIAKWAARIEDILPLIQFNALSQVAKDSGLHESVALTHKWPDAKIHLATAFERTWYTGIVREAIKSRPAIAQFERTGHEAAIQEFRSLDSLALKYNRTKVALTHWRTVPRGTAGGTMGWLMTQFNLRQSHRPIRLAMEKAGDAIQAIKPVFLMSPLSVAMYLPATGPKFDLVIFDEASQVKPEDALGSLLRGDQTIVVGDSKQMPPTSFFEKLTSEEVEDDDDFDEAGSSIKELESVLAMMSSKVPERSPRRRWLRWHYRSEHDALIATSNRLSYENRLIIFPSPWRGGANSGLIFRYDPTTVYGRGNTRKNVLQARAVALAAQKHVQEHPKLTLGIAAFSKPQQDAILDEIEILRRGDSSFDVFDTEHPFEKLFVKNLENVQGDERDVIFISIGYGRDENGYVSQSFGPLNRDGGERRLNVLMTRARKRCEVFSNIKAADIREDATTRQGVRHLRVFLAYADSGSLDVPTAVGAETESPFEDAVLKRLRRDGYDVEPQVGSAGFFIDLAVRHPELPQQYVLGIECDGAKYHSARSARDRDKIRQKVLVDRGWRIHRIWSTDWFHNSEREYERLQNAIAAAIASSNEDIEDEISARPSTYMELDREDDQLLMEHAASPYILAEPSIYFSGQLHEVSPSKMADWIVSVVDVEGPVHLDEVLRRIREAAGLGRAGNRIQAAVEAGAKLAQRQERVVIRSEFLYKTTKELVLIRSRASLGVHKRLEYVPTEEIRAALCNVIARSFGIEPAEAINLAVRLLGFERTTSSMVARMQAELDAAISENDIDASGELLRKSGKPTDDLKSTSL